MDYGLWTIDHFTNIAFIYHILKIIDLIDDAISNTFVPPKAENQMLKDIINLIITLYHPERMG
jgi:hypothetical protein